MGLPRSNRLKQRKDFPLVYQQGLCCRGSHLTLWAWSEYRNKQKNQPRESLSEQNSFPVQIAIVVSQKVSKKAVIRNRLKRKMRQVFRDILPLILPGWKIIVSLRPGAQECQEEHFLRELKQLLIKAEVMDGHSRKHLL